MSDLTGNLFYLYIFVLPKCLLPSGFLLFSECRFLQLKTLEKERRTQFPDTTDTRNPVPTTTPRQEIEPKASICFSLALPRSYQGTADSQPSEQYKGDRGGGYYMVF